MRRSRLSRAFIVACHTSALVVGCSSSDGDQGGDTTGESGSQDASSTTSDASVDTTDSTAQTTSTGVPPAAPMAVDDVFAYHEDLFPWSADSPTVLDNDELGGATVQFSSAYIMTEQRHEVRLGDAGEVEWDGDGAIVDDAFTYTILPSLGDGSSSSARVELAVSAMTHDVEDLRADGRSVAITLPEGFDVIHPDLGDLDGDGYGDFAAFRLDGRFDVVLRDDGVLPTADELAAGTRGFRVTSAAAIHAAGDFNGDGIDDLLVSGGYALSIVFGGVDLSDFSTDDPPGEWGVRLDDDLGAFAPRAVGDVDGDGRDDLVLDNPIFATPNGGEGRAIVVLGRSEPGEVSSAALLTDGGAYSVTARADAHSVSEGLARAGDVNGDGLADWLLSGRLTTGGAAWVIFGTPDHADIDLDQLGNGGFEVILGHNAAGDPFALSSMNAVGDHDGDGLDDIAVSDTYFDHGEGAAARGKVVVVWGKATGEPVDLDRLGTDGRTIDISEAGAPGHDGLTFFGEQIRPLGDIDGDGRGDFGFASHEAFRYNPRAGQVGRIYVVLGRERDASVSVPDLSRGDGGFVLVGGRDDRAQPSTDYACLEGPDGCDLLVARVASDHRGLELIPLPPLAGG